MRNILLILTCSVLALFSTGAVARDQFDGKWTITVTSDDGGKPYEDTLTFKAGKFVSEKGKAKGFAEAAYEADTRGAQAATFTGTTKSNKEGIIKWTGTIAVSQIQGTFSWTKGDGSTETFTYMGTRAEK
jgi:hypothetical protein